MEEYNIISKEQSFGSSKKIQLINMTPMESLLTVIDYSKKRHHIQQEAMSIKSILDNHDEQNEMNRPLKRACYHKEERKDLVTMTCYHASIAQKSYGTEKRFLCPPPIVMISNTNQNPIVSMSVVCETTQSPLIEQRTLLDEHKQGSFKYLFVNGTAKAKQFCLRVHLNNPPHPTFYSNPISIISKPSKKTTKSRNISTCLFNHSYVSLFNRINSQTVRTKYLTTENNQFCAKHSSWSPFEIIILGQRSSSGGYDGSVAITYGTEIILKDIHSNTSSPPLIIRKVNKGQIIHDDSYGLVSQMQKIVLQLASTTTPLYLNSNGNPMTSSTYQHTNAWTNFVASKMEKDKTERVDDYLCWTIIGISKFECHYPEVQQQSASFNHHPTTLKQLSPPPSPPTTRSIIPYPIISSIQYIASSHSLNITGENLIEPAPYLKAVTFWLGAYGPLKSHKMDKEGHRFSISLPDTQELLVLNHDMLITRLDGSRYFELPLLFALHDGFTYYSRKTLCCDIAANYESKENNESYCVALMNPIYIDPYAHLAHTRRWLSNNNSKKTKPLYAEKRQQQQQQQQQQLIKKFDIQVIDTFCFYWPKMHSYVLARVLEKTIAILPLQSSRLAFLYFHHPPPLQHVSPQELRKQTASSDDRSTNRIQTMFKSWKHTLVIDDDTQEDLSNKDDDNDNDEEKEEEEEEQTSTLSTNSSNSTNDTFSNNKKVTLSDVISNEPNLYDGWIHASCTVTDDKKNRFDNTIFLITKHTHLRFTARCFSEKMMFMNLVKLKHNHQFRIANESSKVKDVSILKEENGVNNTEEDRILPSITNISANDILSQFETKTNCQLENIHGLIRRINMAKEEISTYYHQLLELDQSLDTFMDHTFNIQFESPKRVLDFVNHQLADSITQFQSNQSRISLLQERVTVHVAFFKEAKFGIMLGILCYL
ncbi:uncharacterized protein BX663DRAFT_486358 [Cokeromyces recurvatus]|uniref:uncharacterized protein n=1 Tax=Cokeromyces recurvatus TaxID=90255 RepID=UPI00221F2049|nr:uncharacterized protein BX663DRAFT_486358 [Cokeromyces recurvatus]KAI7903109.1 hypothetical protein BX663DRAFT_486358 [Cokeromyces recurvatus]